MWELSAKGGEFGEGICSKISEGFGQAVGRSSVLAVLSDLEERGGDDAGAALWWAGLALAKLRIISGGRREAVASRSGSAGWGSSGCVRRAGVGGPGRARGGGGRGWRGRGSEE